MLNKISVSACVCTLRGFDVFVRVCVLGVCVRVRVWSSLYTCLCELNKIKKTDNESEARIKYEHKRRKHAVL